MIIKQVDNNYEASECDKLLTTLIATEKEFNENIKNHFVVKDYFKNLYNKNNSAIFIAIEEKIIGYIYVKIITSLDGPQLFHEAIIDGLFVIPEYRNQSVATKLIEESKKWCIRKGVKYICLEVLTNNEVAKQLYYKEGFKNFSEVLKQKL